MMWQLSYGQKLVRISPSLYPAPRAVDTFMDNLPAHKVQGVAEILEAVGAKAIYNAPYSPEFNLIQHSLMVVIKSLHP